ncbi:MAG TPA: hypothetical protein VMH30_09085 [Verrucomicrobiae bacterium]|nr:hypothetical protein [Verrucomicrobiae bacterium]
MSDEISNTIEVLVKKVAAKEEEANKLKRLVNELCVEAGVAPHYASIADSEGTIASIRADHFYGQTVTAAIRKYLEIRKASNLGAATVSDIYAALRDGGFKFGSKTEDIAKIVVANNLRKSSSIFHRLPNGQYGLLVWYPNAKSKPDETEETKKPSKENVKRQGKDNGITNSEIRDIVLAQTGEFKAADIEALIKAKFPSKDLPGDKIPVVIFLLKKKGLLKVVAERVGRTPAVYTKA